MTGDLRCQLLNLATCALPGKENQEIYSLNYIVKIWVTKLKYLALGLMRNVYRELTVC